MRLRPLTGPGRQRGWLRIGAKRALLGGSFDYRSLFRNGEQGGVWAAENPDLIFARRNLASWSEALSNVWWTKTDLTVTDNAASSGAISLSKLVEGSAATASLRPATAIASLTAGRKLTRSFYVKRGTHDWLRIMVTDSTGAANGVRWWFNMATGLFGTSGAAINPTDVIGATNQSVQDLGGGVYRISVSCTPAWSGAVTTFTMSAVADASFTRIATGERYEGGQQFEVGALTDYQKVTDWNTEFLAGGGNAVTMFQDSLGATPVTAVGQPVGLLLDKRLGALRADNQIPAGDSGFNNGQGAWVSATPTRANYDYTGGKLRITNANNGSTTGFGTASYAAVITAGKWYEVTADITAAGTSFGLAVSTSPVTAGSGTTLIGSLAANSVGPRRIIFPATVSGIFLNLAVNTATLAEFAEFDNVVIREIAGNHATQSTAASRPTLSARYNVWTKTEDFADAIWSFSIGGTGTGIKTPNFALAPDGTMTACRVQLNLNGGVTSSDSISLGQGALGGAGVTRRRSAWVKLNTGSAGTFTWQVGGGGAGSLQPVTDQWQLLSSVVADDTNGSSFSLRGNFVALGQSASIDLLVWHPDLRTTADAALNIPAYQRVNTATDYDTVGFPHGEDFDGVDDFAACATGGDGTTGFFFCAAVRLAGGAGTIRELWTSEATNAGHTVRIANTNQLQLVVGNGAGFTTVTASATLSVGETHVVTAWHDGARINIQLDNGPITSAALAVAAAGTTGFVFGKQNSGSSRFFNGRMFSPVQRFGTPVSAVQCEKVKRLVARKAGVLL